MNFQTIVDRMLHRITKGTDIYDPYVNGEGDVLDTKRIKRSDYDDTTMPERKGTIHGGVDIYYYKMVNGTPQPIGSREYPNKDNPQDPTYVYAPVSGKVINVNLDDGGVSILDENGYVHTIYHMSDIEVDKDDPLKNNVIAGVTRLGIMDSVLDGSTTKIGNHVHYEITTYLNPPVKVQKIDPEAFWNNYQANEPFTLTGSFKKGNIFYGTSNKEILKGEGVRDNGLPIDPNDNDTLSGGGGSDIIDGGTGDDKLYGGNSYGKGKYYKIDGGKLNTNPDEVKEDTDDSADTLIGGMGKDYLDGGKGDDVLYGGNVLEDTDTSRDTLIGGEGDDTLYGGKGDDKLYGEGGEDTISGGDGDDVIDGGSDDDSLYGDKDKDIINGRQGNDTLYGGVGNDYLIGGEGNDILSGGEGEDTYLISSIHGGNDTIIDNGLNRIIIEDADGKLHIIENVYKTGADVYTAANGKVILNHHSPWQLSLEGGGTITLGEDFQSGDFGIDREGRAKLDRCISEKVAL